MEFFDGGGLDGFIIIAVGEAEGDVFLAGFFLEEGDEFDIFEEGRLDGFEGGVEIGDGKLFFDGECPVALGAGIEGKGFHDDLFLREAKELFEVKLGEKCGLFEIEFLQNGGVDLGEDAEDLVIDFEMRLARGVKGRE